VINVAAPVIDKEEIAAVNDVLQSGMLAQGPKVAELESAFAAYCGTKYAVAVNSGTAAIHAALHAAGVGEGDEVITTPFSFIATINPILMLGAKPVLVDIDLDTYNINASLIESAISAKTKAILPVHLYGQPCDWDELRVLADNHNLVLIEDACQAVGAEYKDKKTGSLGEMGCFSLYATKNIMSGEGGMVTTDSEEYAEAVKRFRQHGMVAPYEYAELGYNYRMSDLHAAIAVEQLKKVDDFNDARQNTAEFFLHNLVDLPGIELPHKADDRSHVFHQFTVKLDESIDREKFAASLRERGVGSGVYYPKPLHAYPHIERLGYKIGDFPIAEQVADQVLSLPVHPRVSEEDAQLIVDVIKEVLHG